MEQRFLVGEKVMVVFHGTVEGVENVSGSLVYQVRRMNEDGVVIERAYVTDKQLKEVE